MKSDSSGTDSSNNESQSSKSSSENESSSHSSDEETNEKNKKKNKKRDKEAEKKDKEAEKKDKEAEKKDKEAEKKDKEAEKKDKEVDEVEKKDKQVDELEKEKKKNETGGGDKEIINIDENETGASLPLFESSAEENTVATNQFLLLTPAIIDVVPPPNNIDLTDNTILTPGKGKLFTYLIYILTDSNAYFFFT